MIQILFKDGSTAVVGRDQVKIVVAAKGEGEPVREYGFGDAKVFLVEPVVKVGRGAWAPPGSQEAMPIRGLMFEDSSDFAVEIPMPVPEAAALGQELATGKIEVAQAVPSALLLPSHLREG